MALMLLAGAAPVQAAAPCSEEEGCSVEGGTYHLALPETDGGQEKLPAVLFFHGYGSSGRSVVANAGLRRSITSRGYMLIAPDGAVPEGRDRRSWAHQGSPSQGRDEMAFVHAVMEDVARRAPLDRDRVLVAGFSQGGSMAWHLACLAPEGFAAFAPVSGAFWEPMPDACVPQKAFRLFHTHGFTDQVVPIEGRAIRDVFSQGDLFAGLDLLRQTHACRSRPDSFDIDGDLRCRMWTECDDDSSLRLCLHDGGHAIPAGWAGRVLDWFEDAAPDGSRAGLSTTGKKLSTKN